MAFPLPSALHRDTADVQRDERKRSASPGSFFFSQGRSIVLAAEYFDDSRLTDAARGGVARKHRHRLHLSLFGQLMASFEYLLKDFVAQSVDACTILDKPLQKEKWIETSVERVLANRSGFASVGSVLVHSTMGWHDPRMVNERYKTLYNHDVFGISDAQIMEKLWIVRHSVAHNAGYFIPFDANRIGAMGLANHAADIDESYIREVFDFLDGVAQQLTETCGVALLKNWKAQVIGDGAAEVIHFGTYKRLKLLSSYIRSRTTDLPEISIESYQSDPIFA